MHLTQEELKHLLHYDPTTGIFTWINPQSTRMGPGSIAGTVSRHSGNRQIGLYGKLYPATKLAWLYMTGVYPQFPVRHKNGVKADNSWDNINAELQRIEEAGRERGDLGPGVDGPDQRDID